MGHFFDLSFEQLPNGSIRLEQESGIGEAGVIDLHPWQLRAVTEHFGLVHSAPPADDLSKQLAEQLCRTYLSMSDDYRRLSHILVEEYVRLDTVINMMPESIFPFHLWDEREQKSPSDAVTGKATVTRDGDGHGEFALAIQ